MRVKEGVVIKSRLLPGIVAAVLGLLIALVLVCIFPTCLKVIEIAAGGVVPMKYFWAGQAEIGISIPILCGGILLVVSKSPLTRIGVSPMTALAGVLSLSVPTLLIGGCEMPTMLCRIMTFPALYVLGASTVTAYVANAFHFWRKNH